MLRRDRRVIHMCRAERNRFRNGVRTLFNITASRTASVTFTRMIPMVNSRLVQIAFPIC